MLEAARDVGACPMGTEGFPTAPPGLDDTMTFGADDTRWQSSLPPDLQRAAPEIYRAMRSEGVANIREWIAGRYAGDKSDKNPEWIDMWNTATEIDFAILRAPMGGVTALLAADDGLEIKLRRLSAHVHMARTGDRNSATAMLAVKPPGSKTDVAPAWLLTESTAFSRQEHQREERVRAGAGAGRGRGRGWRGRGRGTPEGGGQGEGRGGRGEGRGRV